MFSCCRPNPKNPKSAKKDKGKKGDAADGADPEPTEKKLIIPTITIESNGNGTVGENSAADSGDEVADVNGDIVEVVEGENEAVKVTPTSESASTRSIHGDSGGEEGVNAADPNNAKRSCEAIVELTDRSDELSKSSPPTSCTDESVNTVINQYTMASNTDTEATASPIPSLTAAGGHLVSTGATTNGCPQRDTDTDTDAATINDEPEMGRQNGHPTTMSPGQSETSPEDAEPVTGAESRQRHEQELEHEERQKKSCLSRHNSTHTSIKKKVNISVHAEIIEPDPLPPPPYDRLSLGDDDDVFSDSIPAPKRDSMCAPYIPEPDETLLFGHGLPEWFNDERINDIGCIEPPVTPVGRDELELKRQRLYTDLLRAAHAAVEHNVRFTPLCDLDGGAAAAGTAATQAAAFKLDATGTANGGGGGGRDCDPDLKSSVAENLEHLVNRLERLVERLERSVSARELEIANRAFDTVLEKKRESFDLESTELPPLPVCTLERELSQHTDSLTQRIQRIESSLTRINDSHSNTNSQSVSLQQQQSKGAGSLENIPTTVLEDYPNDEAYPPPPPPQQLEEEQQPINMSVYGYQDIMTGPLAQYLALSAKIGGDVATHANSVKAAFDAQLQYVTLATEVSKPSADKQMELLKPTSDQISAIQDFREKRRTSPFFNHLSAISESIPALGWVCVSPTPGPHVKEMNDAGQFYTNRVLKEWKEKDTTHVEWARAWVQTLTELQAFIKQHHTTGLVWSGKGNAPSGGFAPPPPPIGGCPPPPPPPAFDLSQDAGTGDERSALFAEINQGEAITKNLKKVTADMQTHKNPTLRTGPAPFKATQVSMGGKGPAPAPPAAAKAPVFTRDGKKWLIEYQKNNTGLLVEGAEMNNVVYVFRCEGSTLTVKGKVNNIVLDSCKKCSLLFDSVVASVEFVNCQSVQMQALGHVPTISVDKTDGCQMYLSSESLGVEVVSSKSSEMNVMLPEAGGDYTELAVPEQFKTTIQGKTLKTVCVDSLG